MEKTLKDWNAPGIGVGVVVDDKLVFAKGYGYRDYGKRLPVTPQTLFPIASNTKLFTAVAAGFLVEEGKLTWNRPVRESVPSIRFYDDALNNSITLRDMLSHRTGIMRHDSIVVFEFVEENGQVISLKQTDPSGEFVFKRK
jgi:CubicO group peptidase (beta-lactamase class C family)